MRWFQIKEQAAGKKRLLLSWYLYKIFGKNILYIISAMMSFFVVIFSPKIRKYSKKYFCTIEPYTKLKPNIINVYKHIHSYADSLADKIILYSGNFDINNIDFETDNDKKLLFEDINSKNGVLFIFSHIGNIEVLQSLLMSNAYYPQVSACIFLSKIQSQIFNSFLDSIKVKFPVKIFPVEETGISTGIELKNEAEKGNIIFIAGDRVSENCQRKIFSSSIFGNKITLPKGSFKLAKVLEISTYFISAVKINNNYKVILQKVVDFSDKNIIEQYSKYLERVILKNPFQFFHFYDFFS